MRSNCRRVRLAHRARRDDTSAKSSSARTARRRPCPSTCCASTSSAARRASAARPARPPRRFERRPAFQHLEAVGRHQQRLRRLVEPVIGAADALGQPARAFRRADVDDEIDVAPVDAEIERRGRDHRAQLARRHRRLDLAPLADVERAVMQRDRQVIVVDLPQLLEQQLGLAARVDEHQRQPVPLDRLVDLGHRIARRMPRPGQLRLGLQDVDLGLRPAAATTRSASARRARAPAAARDRRAARDGRATVADRPMAIALRRERPQPRQTERQQIAALGGDERMQLVEDDRSEDRANSRAASACDSSSAICSGVVSRMSGGRDALALPAATAGVSPVRVSMRMASPISVDRRQQIALHVDGQRLQRRDVERVDAACPAPVAGVASSVEARQEAGERLAGARRRDQQRRPALRACLEQGQLMRPRRPAARLEPGLEPRRQSVRYGPVWTPSSARAVSLPRSSGDRVAS